MCGFGAIQIHNAASSAAVAGAPTTESCRVSLFAAHIVLGLLAAYLAAGMLFAVALLLGSLRRIDTAAAAAPMRVKLLLVPGMVALWPLMLRRALGWQAREDRR